MVAVITSHCTWPILISQAINALISGLPIRLRDGSVGKVTARIPWPNPLTSSVGLSLESLHLTFYLEPTLADPTERPFTDNLADSVASVAETFIHEELSAREEAALRESFHPDLARSDISEFEENVPGGLDPFISEDEVHQHDAEPPGVSIFATLIERLLARFQFDATDTRITIVNPQNASFTLIVPDIRYSTESQATAPQVPEGGVRDSAEKAALGEVRKVIITGATVTTRCLRPPSPKLLPASPATPPHTASGDAVSSTPSAPTTPVTPDLPAPIEVDLSQSQAYSPEYSPEVPQIHGLPSPAEPSSPYHSDSSDMDEETQMFMSQSIAMLPPRPISPASSVASSMYQSAISTSAPDTGLDDIPEEVPQSRSSTPSPPERVEAREEQASHIPVETVESPTGTPPASRSPVTSPFQRRMDISTAEIEDETVLSLGSEPIEIRLTTPSPRPPVPQPSSSSSSSSAQHDPRAASHPTIDESPPLSRPYAGGLDYGDHRMCDQRGANPECHRHCGGLDIPQSCSIASSGVQGRRRGQLSFSFRRPRGCAARAWRCHSLVVVIKDVRIKSRRRIDGVLLSASGSPAPSWWIRTRSYRRDFQLCVNTSRRCGQGQAIIVWTRCTIYFCVIDDLRDLCIRLPSSLISRCRYVGVSHSCHGPTPSFPIYPGPRPPLT